MVSRDDRVTEGNRAMAAFENPGDQHSDEHCCRKPPKPATTGERQARDREPADITDGTDLHRINA